MTVQSTTTQSQHIKGDYVLVRADALRLLFPLAEVVNTSYLEAGRYSLNSTEDLQALDDPNAKPVYMAISAKMELLPEISDKRFIMTRFVDANIFWCWNEMVILTDLNLPIQSIPANFLQAHTPLKDIVMIDDKPVFVCHSIGFFTYIFRERS